MRCNTSEANWRPNAPIWPDIEILMALLLKRTPDSMDELVLANERDLTVERLNRETFLLRQVADALDRIVTGEYGTCLECEEPISAKRLTALPWAALCLSCQEVADREPREQSMAHRSSAIAEAA